MTIRPALPTDAAAIARVETSGAWHPWSLRQVADALALPTTLAWVAEHDGVIAAHLIATSVVDEGEVLTVTTHPDHRRQGHARALLIALRQRWRELGVERGLLEVRADNAAARALYEGLGWREEGLRRAYYRDGMDAALYALTAP